MQFAVVKVLYNNNMLKEAGDIFNLVIKYTKFEYTDINARGNKMDYPIVFIPGVFGSLGDDVIGGTGSFSFGLAEKIYRPFIKTLNAMGYIEGENLFVSYYDWKRNVLEVVDKYLYTDIEKIKTETGAKKVILICHSLGGLLARAYMSYFDSTSVEKIIMIATPNQGSIDAYYFWSGGKLKYSKVEENILYKGVKIGFMLYYRMFHKINHIEALRNIFPVAENLLPSYGYGDYLSLLEDGIKKDIPIDSMTISNLFLNNLETKFEDYENLYIISGNKKYTNNNFLVEFHNKEKIKWLDGKPIMEYKTVYGDGTVTTASTLANLSQNNIILDAGHIDILYKSKYYISSILNKSISEDVMEEEVETVYIILANNCIGMDIKTPITNMISNQSTNIIDDRVQSLDLGQNKFWIMVTGDSNLEVNLDVEKTSKDTKIYIVRIDKDGIEFKRQ